jgi:hypothetical protein
MEGSGGEHVILNLDNTSLECLKDKWDRGSYIEWKTGDSVRTADMAKFAFIHRMVAWCHELSLVGSLEFILFVTPTRYIANQLFHACEEMLARESIEYTKTESFGALTFNDTHFQFSGGVRMTCQTGPDRIIFLLEDWFYDDDPNYRAVVADMYYKILVPLIILSNAKLLIYRSRLKQPEEKISVSDKLIILE